MRLLPALPLLLAVAFAPGSARAADAYDSCKGYIDAVPTVLVSQGTWCLNKDLSTTQNAGVAITISGNNITIDCNGFKLGGLGAGLSTNATGIKAVGRLNAGVRDCSIRGFATGIYLDGGGGHLIEDNRLDGNTVTGMIVAGDDSTIRRNLILDTGGSTSQPNSANGVWTVGRVDLLDNTISGITTTAGGAETMGLRLTNPGFATVAGNRIRGILGNVESVMRGIYHTGGGHPVIRDNVIGGPPYNATIGIACESNVATTTGNVVVGYAVQISASCSSSGDLVNPN